MDSKLIRESFRELFMKCGGRKSQTSWHEVTLLTYILLYKTVNLSWFKCVFIQSCITMCLSSQVSILVCISKYKYNTTLILHNSSHCWTCQFDNWWSYLSVGFFERFIRPIWQVCSFHLLLQCLVVLRCLAAPVGSYLEFSDKLVTGQSAFLFWTRAFWWQATF